MVLLLLQPSGFPLIQLAAGNSFIDPLFLIRLPLIDHRRVRLGICRIIGLLPDDSLIVIDGSFH
jgi:hypothetical protein